MKMELQDNPGERGTLTKAVILSTVLVGVLAAGSVAPSGSAWGIHAFGFLPPAWLISGVAFFALVVAVCALRGPRGVSDHVLRWIHGHGVAGLLAISGVLIALAILLRSAVPLLGDGYTVLNNFRNTVNGVHPLSTSHEPVGMGFFFGLARILGMAGGVPAADAFLAGDILLLLIFVVCTGFIAQEFFPGTGDRRAQVLTLFAISFPYVALFFGYVEVYAVVLAALSLTMLVVALYQGGKISFYMLPPVFALQVAVHYLGLLLVPLLCVLAWREYRQSGWRTIAAGALLTLPVVVPLLLWLGWDGIFIQSPHSPLLPVMTITDSYTAYTLFSSVHIAEIVNLFFLLGAGSVAAIALAGRGRQSDGGRGFAWPLAIAVLPPLLFAAVAKFDLGTAKDWDVTAPYFYPLALLGGYRLLSRGGGAGTRSLAVITAAVCVSTAGFIGVNADRDASVRRVKALTDPSIMSQGGLYQTSIHLSTAYLETGEIDSMVALWREFLRRYPDDGRGYQKLAKAMWEYGRSAYGPIMGVFENWKARIPDDPAVDGQYAQFCVFVGTASMRGGRLDEARALFRKAMGLDSANATAYLQTGVSYLRGGEADSAFPWLDRALAMKPDDPGTMEALAGAYTIIGDTSRALEARRSAAAARGGRANQLPERREEK